MYWNGGSRYVSTLIWSYKILFGLVHLNSGHFFKLSQIKLEAMASSCINSLALVLCVYLSLLSALLTCGTVYRLLLILVHSVHLSDRFNV